MTDKKPKFPKCEEYGLINLDGYGEWDDEKKAYVFDDGIYEFQVEATFIRQVEQALTLAENKGIGIGKKIRVGSGMSVTAKSEGESSHISDKCIDCFEQGKLAVLEMLEKNVKDFKKSRNKHKKTQGDKYPYWRGMENGQVGLVERLKSQLKVKEGEKL